MISVSAISPPRHRRNWGFVLLWCFGMMQWISMGRSFLMEHFGDFINDIAAVANGVSVGLLVGAVVWYHKKHASGLSFAARAWLFLALTMTLVCGVRGFTAGIIPKFIVLDGLAFVALFSFVVIGSMPQAFADLRRVWFHVLLLSIPLNLFAMMDLSNFGVEISSGIRVARETVSYSTSNTLDVVLLVTGFSFTLPRWQRLVAVLGFCQVIAMQVLYQKRLETFYYAITALLLMGAWWIESGAAGQRLRRYVKETIALGVVFACIALALLGRYLIPQTVALISRTKGETTDVEISQGYARYFLADNERFQIVVESLGTLSPRELVFGRGLGGGAEWVGFNQRLLNSSRTEEVWSAYFMPDYGFFGRRSYEVGWATPVLKGGFLFLVAIYFVYVLFYLRALELVTSVAGRVCLVIVVAQNLYAVFGGDFSLNVIFQMGNYATCLGLGLSVVGRSTDARPPALRPGGLRRPRWGKHET